MIDSRRTFLKLMASVSAGAFFSRFLWPQVAAAQTTPPLRYVQIAAVHGKDPKYWNPQGTDTAFNIDFAGATLRPLQPYRSRLLVFTGLDYKVLIDHQRTGHNGGPATSFTGTSIATDSYDAPTTGPSLDVFLSEKLGGTTPIRSIQIANHADYCTDESSMSYSDSGQKLPNLVSPRAVFDRLFGSFAPPTPMVNPTTRRQALVSYWLKDANALKAKLAAAEQHKLDAHLSALNDINARITAMSSTPATCAAPATPRAYTTQEIAGCYGPTAEQLIPERTKLICDVLAEAFACDMTRFAALRISPGLLGLFDPSFLAMPATQNIHNDLAHEMDASTDAESRLNQVQTWVAQQVAYLLGKLDAVSEGSGTVLDHSLVVWANELSDPAAHSNTDMPLVVAGGGNGKLKMGRAIASAAGTPHNKLLCSVANAFGQNLLGFGDPAYSGQLSLS